MKITVEHEGIVATVEDNDVIDIHGTFRLVKQVLLGVGFHHTSIDSCLAEEIE